ncbi:MAG: hypothetical protein AB1486_15595 [Planctomycetota bacterium]
MHRRRRPDRCSLRRVDLSETPRCLDGKLAGLRRCNMGAREFDHVHLEIEGSLEPGGWLRLTTTGTPGLLVLLLAGQEQSATRLEPYGPIFLDLAHAWWLAAGSIPDKGRLAR